MTKSYDIEVPSIAETSLTGVALVVADTIRGQRWRIACDTAGRPLAVTRNGKSHSYLPKQLHPMRNFAVKFLASANALRGT